MLCRVLGVERSGYYAWLEREPAARTVRQAQLAVQVRAVHQASGETYGSPRVHRELQGQGETVSATTVAKAMKEAGIRGQQKKRFKTTTDSKHTEQIAPNLLKRDFTATAPNEVWVTDVTAVRSHRGWVYLAVILDLFARRVVGWATSENNDSALALTALRKAVASRRPPKGLIHHSDRGSPYGSKEYRRELAGCGMLQSMSRKGDCWDNAVAESFFSTIKAECLDRLVLIDIRSANRATTDYIDGFYNPKRLHSTNGYLSPITFELHFASARSAA
jgi:putative transposase